MSKSLKTIAVVVAHPDDETLWAGGMILDHSSWRFYIVCLCRKSDQERAENFNKALIALNAKGTMGDLNDGPEQYPLPESDVEYAVLQLLPTIKYDLIITHDPMGEYTRHLRHEEVSRAVIKLWHSAKIDVDELWTFAYEDGNKAYYPKPITTASTYQLSLETWQKKYDIVTQVYRFEKDTWEANTTPKEEAFWKFKNAEQAIQRLNNQYFIL